MKRIFWDTNIFIYLIEKTPGFHDKAYSLRRKIAENGSELITSTLTLAEVLVQPFRKGNKTLADQYRKIFLSRALILVSLDAPTAERTAQIRAEHKIKTPDAIQLACAAHMNVDEFYTGDRSLIGKKVQGIGKIRGL